MRSLAGDLTLKEITGNLLAAFDPDKILEQARRTYRAEEPSPVELKEAGAKLADEAARVIAANPRLRKRLIEIKQENEQVIDVVSQDRVLASGFDEQALAAARSVVESFEQFIADNREEIAALQVLYSQPHRRRLEFADLKELAATIKRPPHRLTTESLWRAYETLDKSRVRGAGKQRLLTDFISLIKFALREEHVLQPYADEVHARFENWLARQETLHKPFTSEQRRWLEMIAEHIATSLNIEAEDFKYSPFSQRGGLGRAYQVFGDSLPNLLEELNEVLAA
ncbi:MAG: hypothetical protein ICV60_22945 [Pyrinomonadaceae bacterium]|nr:hypothetical protein [Pyrinomonadaceae bacterium]